MNKNDLVTVEITDLTSDGEGIGRADAFPLFIKDACVGDLAECRVMKLKKTYGYARLIRILRPSPDRTEPLCPMARACGGCQLQQMNYNAELRFKTNKVRQNLKRIGGLDPDEQGFLFKPCIGMKDPWRYRNKAQVPFGLSGNGQILAGFYAAHSHDIIDCEDCLLTFPEAAECIRAVKDWMQRFRILPYDEAKHTGLIRHVLVRKGFATGQLMVCVIQNSKKLPDYAALADALKKIPGFTTLAANINETTGNVILGDRTVTLYGPGYIEDTIGSTRFRISPESFYQVNPQQTQVLYEKALEYAGLTGTETVWDLYCGIGTISLFLARKAARVYGVEIVPRAIHDARENAALNGLSNTEFFTGKAEEILPAWYKENPDKKVDVIVVDPPRKGCDAACLDTILRIQPDRVVYVSCDSATLARDLRILTEGGYRLREVQPVDQFGHTVHVETVCLVSKLSGAKSHLTVKVEMDEMDLTAAESKATYDEIRDWVQENYGVHVTNLNIAKTKQKCGIIECINYNLPKSENSKSPGTPKEKENAIIDAFKHFQMI